MIFSKTPHWHVPAAAVSQQISKHLHRRADGKVSASMFIRHWCHVSSQDLVAQKRRQLWGLISLFPYSLMPRYTVAAWLSAAITRCSENKSGPKWSVQLTGFSGPHCWIHYLCGNRTFPCFSQCLPLQKFHLSLPERWPWLLFTI